MAETDNLMTQSDFEESLRAWGASARMEMARILSSKTHGKGTLEKIKIQVKEHKKTGSHSVGFNFKRYGVFVSYGVGRGWIRQNGTVVRGSRVKKGSEIEAQLRSKGYSKKDVRDYVIPSKGGEGRKPVDWFDSVLFRRAEELADIAQAYYGDYSTEKMLEMMRRMTITKKAN